MEGIAGHVAADVSGIATSPMAQRHRKLVLVAHKLYQTQSVWTTNAKEIGDWRTEMSFVLLCLIISALVQVQSDLWVPD